LACLHPGRNRKGHRKTRYFPKPPQPKNISDLTVVQGRLFRIIEAQISEPRRQQTLIAQAAELAQAWDRMSPLRMRAVLLVLLQRVDVAADQVIVHLRLRRLAAVLDDNLALAGSVTREDEPTLALSHPIHLRRAGKEVRMVIDNTGPFASPAKPDPSLIKAIGRAHHYHALLVKHGSGKFADLAKREKLHRSYFSQILRLAYLAPDITTAIIERRQLAGLTATTLIEHSDLPLSWAEQRSALGFA
jgi:hypothetical protein